MTMPRILIDQFEPWVGELDVDKPHPDRLLEATTEGARGIRAFVEMTDEIARPLKRAERNSLIACAHLGSAHRDQAREAELDAALTNALFAMHDLKRALVTARPTQWAMSLGVAWMI